MFLTTQTKNKNYNTIVKIQMSWKEPKNLKLNELFVSVGDKISIETKYFLIILLMIKKFIYIFQIKRELLKKFIKGKISYKYVILDIEPQENEQFEYKGDACSTHPHNFYIQLLGETGIVGFLFITVLFLY